MAQFANIPSTSGRLPTVRPALQQRCVPRVVRAGSVASTLGSSPIREQDFIPAEYAVIRTPTGQQLVEEGKWFALSSKATLQASSGDGQLRFPAVAVKRTDGEFVKGKPFLADWVVEAELLDEQLQLGGSGAHSSSNNLLGKVLVTKIKHTEETKRLIEEALLS